jgi:hypothetical protein
MTTTNPDQYLKMVEKEAEKRGVNKAAAVRNAKKKIDTGDIPLSWADLTKLIGEMSERANIQFDDKFTANSTLEDVFRGRGHCILFHKWPGQSVGHWVCAVRKDGAYVFYFDSFGKQPYFPLFDMCLGEIPTLFENNTKLQEDDTSDCGRYCLAVIALNKLGYSPSQIVTILDTFKSDTFFRKKIFMS